MLNAEQIDALAQEVQAGRLASFDTIVKETMPVLHLVDASIPVETRSSEIDELGKRGEQAVHRESGADFGRRPPACWMELLDRTHRIL